MNEKRREAPMGDSISSVAAELTCTIEGLVLRLCAGRWALSDVTGL